MKFATPLPLKDQYNGPITTKEAAEGIKLTLQNAKGLLDDAQVLYDSNRFPRAIALAILAIEEKGKVDPLKHLVLYKQEVSKQWKKVRSHKIKNVYWTFPLLKEMGISDRKIIKSFIDPKGDSSKFLDQLKQICFYTEAVKKHTNRNTGCHWWLPSEITEKDLAGVYLRIAYQVVLDDGIHWTSEALDVFKKFHFLENDDVFITDQIQYYKALAKEGHISPDRLEKILHNLSLVK